MWVALLGIIILFIYAVISYVFYHEYFYKTDDAQLFCGSLGQCFVSVLRYGLLDGIGLVRQSSYTAQSHDGCSLTVCQSLYIINDERKNISKHESRMY